MKAFGKKKVKLNSVEAYWANWCTCALSLCWCTCPPEFVAATEDAAGRLAQAPAISQYAHAHQ